jgi:hypothetical protein
MIAQPGSNEEALMPYHASCNVLAGVAELADARDLGSRVRKDVEVRVLSPAFGRSDMGP